MSDVVFKVPAFLLAGMLKKDDQSCAKVLAHKDNELVLEVGGASVGVKLSSKKGAFRVNTVLGFTESGAYSGVVGDTGGWNDAVKEKSTATTSSSRAGSAGYRKDALL